MFGNTQGRGKIGGKTKLPWGDGLVEQSLPALWYPCSWDSVAPDELVVIIPSLLSAPVPESKNADLLRGLYREALANQLATAVATLTEERYFGAQDELRTCLKTLHERGMLVSMPDEELERKILHFSFAKRSGGVLSSVIRRRVTPGRAVNELCCLSCIERVYLDCESRGGVRRRDVNGLDVTMADALVASVHSGVNSAYIYPCWAFAHESFALGAWLGQILFGRSAWMPIYIGELLNEVLRNRDRVAPDSFDGVLLSYIELTIGSARAIKRARLLLSRGGSILVRPRKGSSLVKTASAQWNADLRHSVSKRLAVLPRRA